MNNKSALSDQVRKVNKYSLVTYLKLLGHKPCIVHSDCTIFQLPLNDSPGSMLIVDNKANTFCVTLHVKGGKLMDLVRLLFRETPAAVLSDIVRFRLDLLMSTEDLQPADHP